MTTRMEPGNGFLVTERRPGRRPNRPVRSASICARRPCTEVWTPLPTTVPRMPTRSRRSRTQVPTSKGAGSPRRRPPTRSASAGPSSAAASIPPCRDGALTTVLAFARMLPFL
jgi:hypothetical protein